MRQLGLAILLWALAAISGPSTPTADHPISDAAGGRADAERARVPGPRLDLRGRVPEIWLDDEAWGRLPLRPERWRRRLPEQCRTRAGYIEHCQGEKRVPEPTGAAADRVSRLFLNRRATALAVMHERPYDEWLQEVRGLDPSEELEFPVPEGHATRGFGHTRDAGLRHRMHRGLDIGAPAGTPVRAARGGLVLYANNALTGYGNVVIVLHSNGDSTLYAHLSRALVPPGAVVERGQPIAEVGNTGFAYVPHLHFEFRQRGWNRDPEPQFREQRYRMRRVWRRNREERRRQAAAPSPG